MSRGSFVRQRQRARSAGRALVLTPLALVVLLAASAGPPLTAQDAGAAPRNVVLLIGDGFAQPAVTLARLCQAGPLTLDGMLVGAQSTRPVGAIIPDSAATATAMATGVNTVNGAIGVDAAGHILGTILEAARDAGRATGLVTTTRITHATPAAFAAHVGNRGMEDAIAEQLLDSGVDLAIGGGARHFLPTGSGGRRTDGRDLLQAATEQGWQVVRDGAALDAATDLPLLAVLDDDHLPYRLDVTGGLDAAAADMPSLSALTGLALAHLSADPEGFFLMVEGGRIDHAEHQHDAAAAALEALDFDAAVAVALDFARRDGNTLVLVTADHETGGLSLGREGSHDLDLDRLHAARASLWLTAQRLLASDDPAGLLSASLGIDDLTPAELGEVVAAASSKDRDATRQALAVLAELVSVRSGVTWTTWDHTAADVPVWAAGPGAGRFAGQHPNTHIATGLSELLGLSLGQGAAGARAAAPAGAGSAGEAQHPAGAGIR